MSQKWWVFIERDVIEPTHPNVFIGPFPQESDAILSMEESVLVQGYLDPPIGGTDCYVTEDQPSEDDETWIVDLNDYGQTGKTPDDDTSGPPIRIMWEGDRLTEPT